MYNLKKNVLNKSTADLKAIFFFLPLSLLLNCVHSNCIVCFGLLMATKVLPPPASPDCASTSQLQIPLPQHVATTTRLHFHHICICGTEKDKLIYLV